MGRYEQVKESNARWAARNPEKVAAVKRRYHEKKRRERIEALGGKCSCGATENLKIRDCRKDTAWLQCESCFEIEKSQLPSRQPDWNSKKSKRRRRNRTPEQVERDRQVNLECTARYRAKHSGRRAVLKAKRRAAVFDTVTSFTNEDWEEMVVFCKGLCLRCGKKRKLAIDHIVALTRGGDNTRENIQPLCGSCNSSKGAKDTDYRPENWPFR